MYNKTIDKKTVNEDPGFMFVNALKHGTLTHQNDCRIV